MPSLIGRNKMVILREITCQSYENLAKVSLSKEGTAGSKFSVARNGLQNWLTCETYSALFLFLFYLPYLSSIHEKANCIAILWTVSPHSLGSCLFRGLWATCLPHKGGASR